MEKHHHERLRNLYAAISGVPALLVTPYHWFTKIGNDGYLQHHSISAFTLMGVVALPNNLLSGMSAHPMGWATAHPALRAEGLYNDGQVVLGATAFCPAYEGFHGQTAIRLFFGLTAKEAAALCIAPSYEWLRLTKQNYKQAFLSQLVQVLENNNVITHDRAMQLLNEIYPS